MLTVHVDRFDDWRQVARELLLRAIPPEEITWFGPSLRQADLFGNRDEALTAADLIGAEPPTESPIRISKAFLDLAKKAACHRNPQRWPTLYRLLWRLTHGRQPHLLEVTTDDDVHTLLQWEKAVRRDAHKMKAFVRFRKVPHPEGDHYIAWHRPDHWVVRLTAPFFQQRFSDMRWTILTPDESVSWDRQRLQFGPGVPASEAPEADELEDLWRGYYAAIFNPARIKLQAMRREMPVRHWPTLPETQLIDELLADAPRRVAEMIARQEGFARTARDFFPSASDLASLRQAALDCRACSLCEAATQTVFGSGPQAAKVMFVGEQPGDEEDLRGEPFVGPAGQLLDEAFQSAGIDRGQIYLTNVVKHFKYQPRGRKRIHQKPNSREISACRPWLEAEIGAVQPPLLVCLGTTAAQAIFGPTVQLTRDRGQPRPTRWAPWTLATWHPAAILRLPNAELRQQRRAQWFADLKIVAAALRTLDAAAGNENQPR